MNKQATIYQTFIDVCVNLIAKSSTISIEIWIAIASLLIAFASFLLAFFQYRENQKVQIENIAIQKQNIGNNY